MQTIRQPDGTYTPNPDYHPTDLVTVLDVYGHRHRVRREHLDGQKIMLPRYNQHGQRIRDKDGRFRTSEYVHRENIAAKK